jgi:hypothetical protein
METWNREELYAEIWKEPAIKVAAKYGVSSVMLGKVCRKLQIPLPGRGYWAKKEFGKSVKQIPLPQVQDLPIVRRLKEMGSENAEAPCPEPEPTDSEYQRILQIESSDVIPDPETTRHKLVIATAKSLRNAKPDNRGIVQAPGNENSLNVRVSKTSIDRALNIMNAVVKFLESENFPFTVKSETHEITAQVFGQNVPFSIVERARETSRKEVREYSYTRTVIKYQPSGELEFRAGDDGYRYRKFRDRKTQKLETLIPKLAGAILREARDRVIRAEKRRLEEIEERKKTQERAALAEQIAEEEKKLKNFESWVNSWTRAQEMRDFIAALEKTWQKEGQDLSPESPKGQRIFWMKQQADRVDPLIESPKSILDRRPELNHWY